MVNIPVSEAKKRANKKWTDANYKRIALSVPNSEAETLERHCKEKGYTKAGFIREAIKEKIERDD